MLEFDNIIVRIRDAIASKKLPGEEAQFSMSPVTRKIQEAYGRSTTIARKSAVLILIYTIDGTPYISMIKRPVDNTVHSGQVSFPGGKVEEEDKSIADTALREAFEEVGINKNKVVVLGQLTKLFIPPSNFDVYPIVGYSNERPDFIVSKDEVDKLLEVRISDLLNAVNFKYKPIRHRDGNEFVVPCYFVKNEVIWGASAMILSEFLSIIKDA